VTEVSLPRKTQHRAKPDIWSDSALVDVLAHDMPKTRDPARLAIAKMLRKTIADAGMPSEDKSRDGTIFILTLPGHFLDQIGRVSRIGLLADSIMRIQHTAL